MQKENDGMVNSADFVTAIDEIKRGEGEKIMGRLFKTEPHLACYLEGIAAHFTNPKRPTTKSLDGFADALDRILVVVRVLELGHYRVWKDAIPPSSPLARLMDPGPQDGPKNEQKK